MNVRHVIIYTFSVSSFELHTIQKALKESQSIDARDLSDEIQKHVNKSRQEIQRKFQAQETFTYKEDTK